jgi:dihydropteroate synthase
MFSLNCNGKLLFIEKPLVMGILNITDDSFYAGSRMQSLNAVKDRAEKMLREGADMLDLGAQSTRPGSNRISAEDELNKLLPSIKIIKQSFPESVLSIDTYHAKVAKECVAAGAAIINDISGGEMDKEMIKTVGNLGVPYICMHMKGVPETMQQQANYENVTREILDFFIAKIEECKSEGIKDIIIDPGFGFGKNISQNFLLLKNLELFKILDKPIMAGLSRKSTIYRTLKVSPEESLNGTTVLNTIALLHGVSILRVHDVKEAREAISLIDAYRKA